MPDAVLARAALEVRDLGRADYGEVLELQRGLARERAAGAIPDTLLLVEHPPVVTLGRGASGRSLRATGLPVYEVERGGDATWHGPGQLVGYPIVHLGERGLRVGPWLRLIEDALIDALAAFGVPGERLKGFTGVWARGRKAASIGIAVRDWVSFHGFALNVDCDLAGFASVYPCGLEPGQMTSLKVLLGAAPDAAAARAAVEGAFRRRLA